MNGISMQQGIAGFARTVLVSGGLGLGRFGAGRRHRPGGAALRPVRLVPWDDPGGGPGGPFNSPGPPNWDWNICHTYHTVNWGQGNVDHLGWRESTAGQPGSRRAVVSPGHQGLRPLARLADRFWTGVDARSAPEAGVTQGLCHRPVAWFESRRPESLPRLRSPRP